MAVLDKTFWGDIEVHLEWIPYYEFFKNNIHNQYTATSCFCLPISEDKILLTLNPRGWDFLGGHVENEETPVECMTRESMEEAGVDIKSSKFLGAVKVFNPNWKKGDKYPETSYQLFYSSHDYDMKDFNPEFECIDRDFIFIKEIPNKHHNLLNVHKEILNFI